MNANALAAFVVAVSIVVGVRWLGRPEKCRCEACRWKEERHTPRRSGEDTSSCTPGYIYTLPGVETYMRCPFCGWDFPMPITWDFSPQIDVDPWENGRLYWTADE